MPHNNTTATAPTGYWFVASEAVVTTALRQTLETVIDLGICIPISILGMLTNVLIIAVFYRQGLADSVTISFSAIAFWDLITCTFSIVHRMYGILEIAWPAEAYSWRSISGISAIGVLVYASYVSAALAACVAAQRCICVAFPLKARQIITPRRTIAVMTLTSVVVFTLYLPFHFTFRFEYLYREEFQTHVYILIGDSTATGQYLFYNVMANLWPTVSFAVMVISSFLIVYNMKRSTKFRMAAQTDASLKNKHTTTTEKKVEKTVLTLFLFYITLVSLPRLWIDVTRLFVPEFYSYRKYHNLFSTCGYIFHTFMLLNATVNFFIFIKMNSDFKETYLAHFWPFTNTKKSTAK